MGQTIIQPTPKSESRNRFRFALAAGRSSALFFGVSAVSACTRIIIDPSGVEERAIDSRRSGLFGV